MQQTVSGLCRLPGLSLVKLIVNILIKDCCYWVCRLLWYYSQTKIPPSFSVRYVFFMWCSEAFVSFSTTDLVLISCLLPVWRWREAAIRMMTLWSTDCDTNFSLSYTHRDKHIACRQDDLKREISSFIKFQFTLGFLLLMLFSFFCLRFIRKKVTQSPALVFARMDLGIKSTPLSCL